MPTFNWSLLNTPAIEDLNSCPPATENGSALVADDPLVLPSSESETDENTGSIPLSETAGEGGESQFPVGINWADIPQHSGPGNPYITRAECRSNGGKIVGDIGDGTMFQLEYRCESGVAPVAYITYLNDEPISVEGEVCCAYASRAG